MLLTTAPAGKDFASAIERPAGRLVAAGLQHYVQPANDRFLKRVRQLEADVARQCAYPGPVTRKALQRSFDDAVHFLGAISFVSFGPAADNNRLQRLNTPIVDTAFSITMLRGMLAGLQPVPEDLAALATQPSAVQGLPALEWLMQNGLIQADSRSMGPACRLAALITANVTSVASVLTASWYRQDGFGALLLFADSGNPLYRTPEQALSEFLTAFLAGIVALTNQMAWYGAPGERHGASAKVPTFAAPRSGFLYLEAQANGLIAFARAMQLEAALAPSHRAVLSLALSELASVMTIFRDARFDRRDRLDRQQWADLRTAGALLTDARTRLETDVLASLGVSVAAPDSPLR